MCVYLSWFVLNIFYCSYEANCLRALYELKLNEYLALHLLLFYIQFLIKLNKVRIVFDSIWKLQYLHLYLNWPKIKSLICILLKQLLFIFSDALLLIMAGCGPLEIFRAAVSKTTLVMWIANLRRERANYEENGWLLWNLVLFS